MAVDFSALQQNGFWKQKFRRACEVGDTNGDGYISRADFVQMADQLKKRNVSTPKHIERYTQYLERASDFFSLVDDSVRFSIEDFQEKWIVGMKKWVESGTIQNWFGSMFDVLDTKTGLSHSRSGLCTIGFWVLTQLTLAPRLT